VNNIYAALPSPLLAVVTSIGGVGLIVRKVSQTTAHREMLLSV